jgi:hypothetical protein
MLFFSFLNLFSYMQYIHKSLHSSTIAWFPLDYQENNMWKLQESTVANIQM